MNAGKRNSNTNNTENLIKKETVLQEQKKKIHQIILCCVNTVLEACIPSELAL